MIDSGVALFWCTGGAGVLFGIGLTAGIVWFSSPQIVIKIALQLLLWRAGFKVKKLTTGGHTYGYAEKGTQQRGKPSMLFVHGFTTSKDSWMPIVSKLPKDLHVLMVDLPGHGESSIPAAEDDITLDALTDRFHELVLGLGLRKFHLIGISLGGAISQNYAVTYPDELQLLTLICPAMRTPHETEFHKEVKAGKCVMLAENAHELSQLVQRTTFTKPKLNHTLLKGLIIIRKPKKDYYQRVFDVIQKIDSGPEGREFEERVKHIVTPTSVIWGKEDEILDVTGAELLKSRLSVCRRVDIIERCGHSVGMDRPGSVVKALLTFRNDMLTAKDKSL